MRKIVLSCVAVLATLVCCLGTAVNAAAGTAAPREGAGLQNLMGELISCGAPSDCFAIWNQSQPSSTNAAPPATALEGTAWKAVRVKFPKGAQYPMLTGVSCKAATYCLVAGEYEDSSFNHRAYLFTWNGTALTPVGAPPLPRGDSAPSIAGVSCVAVRSCVLFGSADTARTMVVLVWTLNAGKWTVRTAALPAQSQGAGFDALHCVSLAWCAVAGDYITGTSTLTSHLIFATWNGRTFTRQKAVVPAGFGLGFVNDLSCASARSCVAVGSESSGKLSVTTGGYGFAEMWNGTAWTPAKWTGPKGVLNAALMGVSCALATSCVAVGVYETSKSTVAAAALSWNGSKWSELAVPGFGKGVDTALSGVSCPRSGTCVAVGDYGPPSATTGKPLASYWNGKAWRLKPA